MPASEYILKHLFQNDPIRWLNEGAFSAASMKKIKRFTVVESACVGGWVEGSGGGDARVAFAVSVDGVCVGILKIRRL